MFSDSMLRFQVLLQDELSLRMSKDYKPMRLSRRLAFDMLRIMIGCVVKHLVEDPEHGLTIQGVGRFWLQMRIPKTPQDRPSAFMDAAVAAGMTRIPYLKFRPSEGVKGYLYEQLLGEEIAALYPGRRKSVIDEMRKAAPKFERQYPKGKPKPRKKKDNAGSEPKLFQKEE